MLFLKDLIVSFYVFLFKLLCVKFFSGTEMIRLVKITILSRNAIIDCEDFF